MAYLTDKTGADIEIEGEKFLVSNDGKSFSFRCKLAIDSDGSGSMHGDPDGQHDTSLHLDGKALNADKDRYIVFPPPVIEAVEGIVLGCQCHAHNLTNGLDTDAVAGDVGPKHKIGEGSVAVADALKVPDSPVNGGEDRHVIIVTVYPGVPAIVNGKQYTLQPYRP